MKEEYLDSMEWSPEERGECFMKLYVSVQSRLYGYVISLVPDASAVEDVIQETVAYMWSHFEEFQPGTNFAAWAVSVARNKVYDYIKQSQKKKRYFSHQTMQRIEEVIEKRTDPIDDRLDVLRQCISKLPEKDRKILIFRYELGATLKSVSERVGQNINTLYNRLYQIRIALLNCVRREKAQEERL